MKAALFSTRLLSCFSGNGAESQNFQRHIAGCLFNFQNLSEFRLFPHNMSISLGFRRFLYRHSETNFLSVAREYPRHSDFPNVLCALFRRNIRFSAYIPKADRLPVSLRGICARVQVPLCRLPSRQCVSRKNLPPRQARGSHGRFLRSLKGIPEKRTDACAANT